VTFNIRQFLAVPLLGSNGDVLGMFGVLDRIQPGPINDEDVRRARALAAQIAIALELTRNLHQSEEHRHRAEALVAIALELNTVLHLPEFMRNFALRAGALLGSRSVALLLQSSEPDMVLISGASEVEDKPILRRIRQALDAALAEISK
jgi:GAF domain-containing protein